MKYLKELKVPLGMETRAQRHIQAMNDGVLPLDEAVSAFSALATKIDNAEAALRAQFVIEDQAPLFEISIRRHHRMPHVYNVWCVPMKGHLRRLAPIANLQRGELVEDLVKRQVDFMVKDLHRLAHLGMINLQPDE